jgi:hypothetical protein
VSLGLVGAAIVGGWRLAAPNHRFCVRISTDR